MKSLALRVSLFSVILLTVGAIACGSEPTALPPFIINPPPTATQAPPADADPERAGTAGTPAAESAETPAPTAETSESPAGPTPLNAGDLSHLPDDPTELMLATKEHSLADIGRKMAFSHNEAFIPVILEFMRFQQNEEARLTLASFLVRIKERIPEEQPVIVPEGQDRWDWWVRWLSENPHVSAPEGYDAWKGYLFGLIDEPMGAFMYAGVPATIRLEEIVWGGVRRDGIPDLRFPPHIPPEEASYLETGDRVFGVSINGEHRAYPLRVLNPHEMANDILGGVQFALAY